MKAIALLIFATLLAIFARGDYIFSWNVDLDEDTEARFSYASMLIGEGTDKNNYSIANLASDDGGNSGIPFVEVKGGASATGGVYTDPVWSYLGSSIENKSFYFELLDAELGVVGSTALRSLSGYTVLMTGDNLNNSGTQNGGVTFTVTSDMVSVPEPTSGLLVLLGVAGLALKRKRSQRGERI